MKNVGLIVTFAVLVGTSSYAFADTAAMDKQCEEMMKKVDTDHDGNISEDEFLVEKKSMFAKYDTDGNHMLSKSEHHTMMEEMHEMMMCNSPMNHGEASKSGHKM